MKKDEEESFVKVEDRRAFITVLYPLVFKRIEFYYDLTYRACLLSLTNVGLVIGWKFASKGPAPDTTTKLAVIAAMGVISLILYQFLKGILYWSKEYGALQLRIEELLQGHEPGAYGRIEALLPPTGRYYGIPTSPRAFQGWFIFGVPILPWIVATAMLWSWNDPLVSEQQTGVSNQVIEYQTDNPVRSGAIDEARAPKTDSAKDDSQRDSANYQQPAVVRVKGRIEYGGDRDSSKVISAPPK